MSDAPLPPDADDSDNGRSQRTVLRLSDAGAIAAARLGALGQGSEESLNVAPDGQAPDTAPPPSASAGREPDDAPRPPADGDQTPAGADPVAQAQDERSPLPLEVEKADDLQPMLDLRFPDAPDAPPAPVPEAPQAGPDTIAAPAAAEPVAPFPLTQFAPLNVPQPRPPMASEPPGRAASEPPAAPMPMQVSPILRALDDVEMRTQADHARVDPSPGEPFGAGILLPRPPWADDALPPPPRPAGGGWQDEGEPTAAEPSPAPAGDPVSRPPPRAVEGGHQRFRPPSGEPPPLSEAVFDAAAKIAAEASATAEALENLKRLLEHKLPTLELVTPPGRFEHAQERFAAPPPAPAHPVRITAGLPPIMASSAAAPPLPMPLASEQGSGTALYVRGFLAGLGLALVTGIVLYLFISIG